MKLEKGWNWVNVQSRPGVTLHCEQACEVHPSHDGAMGWLDTAVNTPIGTCRPGSENTRCGRSRVENRCEVPSVKLTSPEYGSSGANVQVQPSAENACPALHSLWALYGSRQ